MQILIELQRSFVIYIAQLIFNVYYYWVSTDQMTSKHPKTVKPTNSPHYFLLTRI